MNTVSALSFLSVLNNSGVQPATQTKFLSVHLPYFPYWFIGIPIIGSGSPLHHSDCLTLHHLRHSVYSCIKLASGDTTTIVFTGPLPPFSPIIAARNAKQNVCQLPSVHKQKHLCRSILSHTPPAVISELHAKFRLKLSMQSCRSSMFLRLFPSWVRYRENAKIKR